MKKIVLVAFVLVLLSSTLISKLPALVETHSANIVVPDDYERIQWAIGNATDGDTILVRAGTYYEHVTIDKPISLIGENRTTTIIDANDESEAAIRIEASNISINGFTIQNGGMHGVLCSNERDIKIERNIIKDSFRGVCFWNSTNITLGDNIIEKNTHGISLNWATSTEIAENTITENTFGIWLDNSNGIRVKENVIEENRQDGLFVFCCNSTYIAHNIIVGSPEYGMWLYKSSATAIIANNFESNYVGISLEWAFDYNIIACNVLSGNNAGIGLHQSSNNNILSDNIITESSIHGIGLADSNENRIFGNTIANNSRGLTLSWESQDNIISNNNFINNTIQASSGEISAGPNTWDNGYPSGGNFWSDYAGVDFNSGRFQNETGSDGMGDTPYVIYLENEDKYPLMNPHILPDMQPIYSELYELLANYTELQSKYDNLVASYNSSQTELDDLQSKYNALTNELNITRNIMYAFLITTIVFIATTLYIVIRKPKVKPELKIT